MAAHSISRAARPPPATSPRSPPAACAGPPEQALPARAPRARSRLLRRRLDGRTRILSAPHLQQRSERTGAGGVNMAVLDGGDIVYIEHCGASASGAAPIDLNLHVGAPCAACSPPWARQYRFLPGQRASSRTSSWPTRPDTITDEAAGSRRPSWRRSAEPASPVQRRGAGLRPALQSPRRSARAPGEVVAAEPRRASLRWP